MVSFLASDAAYFKQLDYSGFSFSNGTLEFKEVLSIRGAQKSCVYSVALKDVIPKMNIFPRAGMFPAVYSLGFDARKGQVLIRNGDGSTERDSSFSIEFTNEETASRVGKALEHLIRLSGGEDEPF